MSFIDPVILFFLLGLIAGLVRSELRLGPAVYELVSVVLLLSIGSRGASSSPSSRSARCCRRCSPSSLWA